MNIHAALDSAKGANNRGWAIGTATFRESVGDGGPDPLAEIQSVRIKLHIL
jgi:hypothetical protein